MCIVVDFAPARAFTLSNLSPDPQVLFLRFAGGKEYDGMLVLRGRHVTDRAPRLCLNLGSKFMSLGFRC